MAQRRMVLTHLDPFSVLKFGAVANVAVAAIGVVAGAVVLRVVGGSGLVDQVCDIATDVGFLACGVDIARLTRQLVALAALWVVVQTVLVVLLAVLHNLIAGMTGGITVVMDVEGPAGGGGGGSPAGPSAGGGTGPAVVARPGPAGPDQDTTVVPDAGAFEAIVPPRAPRVRPPDAPGGRLFGDRGGVRGGA